MPIRNLKINTFLLAALMLLTSIVNAQLSIPAGSYLIDPSTKNGSGKGVEAYGMIQELLNSYNVPIYWVVRSGKAKDATDYTIESKTYKGSLFVVPAGFITPAVQTVINNWTAASATGPTAATNYYKRGYVTAAKLVSAYTFSGANVQKLTSAPIWTLDDQNGKIAQGFIEYAGIPVGSKKGTNNSQVNWKAPADLDGCDDIFVMPHADPDWATHGNLLTWNANNRGAIWTGCHAGSALSNTYNPNNTSQQMNFLTTKVTTAGTGIILPLNGSTNYSQNSLILWKNHKDGTTPYNTNTGSVASGTLDPADSWVSQYIGGSDAAHTNGSEQIYLPVIGGAWLSSTNIVCFDDTQSDINSGKSPGPGVLIAYGYAFGNSSYGSVMLEAGHDIGGTDAANIAAERAFFNWSLIVQQDKQPQITNLNTGITPELYNSGQSYNLSFTYFSPVGASIGSVVWSAKFKDDGTSAGTFTPNNGTTTTTTFVPSTVTKTREVIFTVVVTDACGRTNMESWIGKIQKPVTISGTVFHDANGMKNNKVDGTGSDLGGGLYAILYNNTTGEVVDVVTVNSDGTYSMTGAAGDNLSVYISTTAATKGQTTAPTLTKPAGYEYTGEQNCDNTAGCTGSDGTADGSLSLGTVSGNITQANFGLQIPPTSVDVSKSSPNAPVLNTPVPLDDMPLKGNDAEDLPGSGGSSWSGKDILITSLPTNGFELSYNGHIITQAEINAGGYAIPNYDPTKLVITPKTTPNGTQTTSFTYSTVDQAGAKSSGSTATINFDKGLPVVFGPISATMSENVLNVNWTALSETNNSHYDIELSKDGVNFVTIGSVQSKADGGNSSGSLNYSFSKAASDFALGVSVFAMLLGGFFVRRRNKLAALLIAIGFIGSMYSCSKNTADVISSNGEKLYVRITQVDTKGSKSYSKVTMVVKK